MTKTKSLRFRFASTAAAVVTGAVILFSLVFALQFLPREKHTILQNTQAAAELANKNIVENFLLYQDAIDQRLASSMKPIVSQLKNVTYFQVLDLSGNAEFDSRSIKRSVVKEKVTDQQTLSALQSTQAQTVIHNGEYALILPYSDKDGNHTYSVRYFLSFDTLKSTWKVMIADAILVLLVGIPAAYFIYQWLTKKLIAKPIDQIRSDTNAIAGGDITHRVKDGLGGEFALVADNINNMVDKLAASIHDLEEEKMWKNEFIILASHNLRTPLSIITSAANTLKKDGKTSKESEKFLDIIVARTKQLHALTENLLSISALKGGKLKLSSELFDLMDLVETITKEYDARSKEHKVSLSVESKAEKLIIKGNQDQLFQVIDNLIDNAVKFTPEGGKITISVEDTGSAASVTVSDTGSGMDEATLNKLFESFHRGSSPVSMENEGIGLGLYFVKLAIEAQGGEVSIRSEEGKGTHVTFKLPKAS